MSSQPQENSSLAQSSPHRCGFVPVLGLPNAGKSTLINALVGEKMAIVTPKVQTTRHRIRAILNHPDFQIVFSDTPGILEPKYAMHERMMKAVERSREDADVVLWVQDYAMEPQEALNPGALKLIQGLKAPLLAVLNKVDLSQSQAQVQKKTHALKQALKATEAVAVSALHAFNLEKLLDRILHYLPQGPAFFDKEALSDRPERFFMAEIIREKIVLGYGQEIPYATDVYIEEWKEEGKILHIKAVIIVERESQKPILIGAGGKMLKKIGTQARKDMEAWLGQKVFLELYVKVMDQWRRSGSRLNSLGYEV